MARSTGTFRALSRPEVKDGGVRLFGVTDLDGWEGHTLGRGTRIVSFRDVGAIIGPAPFTRAALSESDADEHHSAVDAVFAHRPVLPAPLGVVFRSEDALVRWLELHYVTLSDGLAFTEGRVAVRVHVKPRVPLPEGEVAVDPVTQAVEIFRGLRDHAVTYNQLSVLLGSDHPVAAFLVERERRRIFEEAVEAETLRHPALQLEITGPWPPYDFVQMQFGV